MVCVVIASHDNNRMSSKGGRGDHVSMGLAIWRLTRKKVDGMGAMRKGLYSTQVGCVASNRGFGFRLRNNGHIHWQRDNGVPIILIICKIFTQGATGMGEDIPLHDFSWLTKFYWWHMEHHHLQRSYSLWDKYRQISTNTTAIITLIAPSVWLLPPGFTWWGTVTGFQKVVQRAQHYWGPWPTLLWASALSCDIWQMKHHSRDLFFRRFLMKWMN